MLQRMPKPEIFLKTLSFKAKEFKISLTVSRYSSVVMYAICISRSVVKQEAIHFSVEGPRTDSALKVVE